MSADSSAIKDAVKPGQLRSLLLVRPPSPHPLSIFFPYPCFWLELHIFALMHESNH